MIKLSIDRNNINDMIERGIKLHGHAGPYLNLGIKMGLMALEMLNVKGYFDLSIEVELEYRTPISCLLDGLQISTGCTLGKGNIKFKDNHNLVQVFFKTGNKGLLIVLKPEIDQLLNFEKKTCEDLGQEILNMTNKELFECEEIDESSIQND